MFLFKEPPANSWRFFYIFREPIRIQNKAQSISKPMKTILSFSIILMLTSFTIQAQTELDFYDIIDDISTERIEADITTLANFGTRHTLSDTLSQTRGIGAARRWIFDSFQEIAAACTGCIEVQYQKNYVEPDGRRIVKPVWINNVLAIQKGSRYPNRYIIMSGDIDSRVSDPKNYTWNSW